MAPAGLLGCTQHLGDEGLGPSAATVADAAETDGEIVLRAAHGGDAPKSLLF